MSRDREYVRSVSGMRMMTEGRRSEQSIYIYVAREHVTEGLRSILYYNTPCFLMLSPPRSLSEGGDASLVEVRSDVVNSTYQRELQRIKLTITADLF